VRRTHLCAKLCARRISVIFFITCLINDKLSRITQSTQSWNQNFSSESPEAQRTDSRLYPARESESPAVAHTLCLLRDDPTARPRRLHLPPNPPPPHCLSRIATRHLRSVHEEQYPHPCAACRATTSTTAAQKQARTTARSPAHRVAAVPLPYHYAARARAADASCHGRPTARTRPYLRIPSVEYCACVR
jgi:hypothetical protein